MFMKAEINLDFGDFFVEVGVVQIGSSSYEMERGVVYDFSCRRKFFPSTFNSSLNTI